MHTEMREARRKRRLRLNLISALKVGLGSALAIGIAALLQLPNPASTGTITLLTLLVHTRRDTIQLIGRRLITFVLTVILCALIDPVVREAYISFALILFLIVLISEGLGWQATLSVNAVIASQFVISHDFSPLFIAQEFVLLCIGIGIALVFNLIQPDLTEREELEMRMERIEEEQRQVLYEVCESLVSGKGQKTRQYTLPLLRDELKDAIEAASRFSSNTFRKDEQWFVPYFEMRLAQSLLLHELYSHTGGICKASSSSELIAEYVSSFIPCIGLPEVPDVQFKQYDQVRMRVLAVFETEKDFENNALMLHILLDLKEYLSLKARFVEGLLPEQLADYQRAHTSSQQAIRWEEKRKELKDREVRPL